MRRLVAALARRDDGVDALRAVDLDQLQIENEQLLARVEQRNGDLLKLKVTTGRSVQARLPASMLEWRRANLDFWYRPALTAPLLTYALLYYHVLTSIVLDFFRQGMVVRMCLYALVSEVPTFWQLSALAER